MRESATYQAILEEGEAIGEARGKVEEARDVLFITILLKYSLHRRSV